MEWRACLLLVLQATTTAALVTQGRAPPVNFVAPEIEARDTFVHACNVMMSVRDERHAPADVVEQFCYTTADVVECKMKLSSVLKEVDEKGGSINAFCRTTYGWFQDKYGKYCPSNCNLLQCRPTCDWLEDQQNLTAYHTSLSKSLTAARKDHFLLGEFEMNLTRIAEDIVELKRQGARANASLATAKPRLAKKEAEFNAVSAKDAGFKSNVDQFEKDLQTTKKTMYAENVTLRERQHEFNQASSSHQDALADIERCTARATKFEGQIERMLPKYNDIEKRLGIISKNMTRDGSAMEEQSTNIGKRQRLVDAAKADHAKAEGELQDGMSAEVSERMQDDLKSLVKTEKRRLTEAQADLHESQHLLHEAKVRQKLARSFKAKLDIEHKALETKKLKLEGERRAANECRSKGENDAARYEKEKSAAETAIKQQETTLEDARRAWKTANTTLYTTGQAKLAGGAELKRASGMFKLGRMEVEGLQAEADKAQAKLLAREDEYNKGKQKEQEWKKTWESENKQLLEKISQNKRMIEDHALKKPELAKQHGLETQELSKQRASKVSDKFLDFLHLGDR